MKSVAKTEEVVQTHQGSGEYRKQDDCEMEPTEVPQKPTSYPIARLKLVKKLVKVITRK